MVSSAQSCGVELQERTEWRGSYTKPDGTHVPTRVEKLGYVAKGATADQIDTARQKVETSLVAPTRDQVEMWLVELSVITARRIDAAETEGLRVAAYASRLEGYPADVAREALLTHPWRFFPSWAELAEVCEKLVKPRRDMLAALARAGDAAAERERRARALPTEQTATLTPEEDATRKAAADKLIAETLAELKSAAKAEAVDRREHEALANAAMWKPGPEPLSQEAAQ